MNCDLSPDLGGGKGLLGGSDDKGLQCRRPKFNPSVRKIPWGKEWLPTPVFLPGEFQEQRSLAGYSLWGRKKSAMTEWIILSFFHLTERNLASLKSKDLPSI